MADSPREGIIHLIPRVSQYIDGIIARGGERESLMSLSPWWVYKIEVCGVCVTVLLVFVFVNWKRGWLLRASGSIDLKNKKMLFRRYK